MSLNLQAFVGMDDKHADARLVRGDFLNERLRRVFLLARRDADRTFDPRPRRPLDVFINFFASTPNFFGCCRNRFGFVEKPALIGRNRCRSLLRGTAEELLLQPAVLLNEKRLVLNQDRFVLFKQMDARVQRSMSAWACCN
jgi:hypothetical protein